MSDDSVFIKKTPSKPTTRESQHLPPTKPLTAGLAPQTTRRSVINGGNASFTAALFLNTSSRSPSACLGGHKDPDMSLRIGTPHLNIQSNDGIFWVISLSIFWGEFVKQCSKCMCDLEGFPLIMLFIEIRLIS